MQSAPTGLVQRLKFIDLYAPYARQAGQALHIPPIYVLAQWAMESDFGLKPNGTFNVAGLGGAGHPMGFQSPSAFVAAYVASMKADFPYFAHPVTSGTPTLAEVFGGSQRYNPGNTTYNQNVANALSTLQSQFGSVLPKDFAMKPLNPGSVPQPSTATNSAGPLAGLWSGMLSAVGRPVEVAFAVVIGLVFIVIGILLLVRPDAQKLVAPIIPKAASSESPAEGAAADV